MSKKIELSRGMYALVDDADFEELNKFNWFVNQTRNRLSAQRKISSKEKVYMHRQVLDAPRGMDVDHINGDSLDNRRSNLRLCTESENARNAKARGGASKFKGVTRRSGSGSEKWIARYRLNDKLYHLGTFEDEEDAARAYDDAVEKSFGVFARTNKMLGLYDKHKD